MRRSFKYNILKVLVSILSVLTATSCELFNFCPTTPDQYDKVMLLYSAGFNNLSGYLKGDIEELKSGYLPTKQSDDVVLVYSHFPSISGYSATTSPTLIRLTSAKDNMVVVDTLIKFPVESVSASAEQVENVLNHVKELFPALSYGMIFSSHATGYLPSGYFQQSQDDSGMVEWSSEDECDPQLAPYSIGQDRVGTTDNYTSYEIELPDFAAAIPMHLDYLLFDACLMGGVEVAYELKEKVGKVGFSQTEVLADGFCYGSLTRHLINNDLPDPEGACIDYFHQYETQSGIMQSATISLIDCSKLSPLAEVCAKLFKKYSHALDTIDHRKVQRYFRENKHWFYDLESILVTAGINEDELNELYEALDYCVIYKAHTPRFMSEFSIDTFCGLSMYLPVQGSDSLDTFYKTLKWNQDTGLVN
jgi:hypothetical protein